MFKRILVPLDGSDLAEEAIGMAGAIARRSHALIDLVMVHQPLFPLEHNLDWTEKEIAAERNYLDRIAGELESGAGVQTQQTLLRGDPAELIVARAADCGADLIVIATHGRTGWSRAWIGSVADAVMRGSNIPVLMLRPAEQRRDRRKIRGDIRRILVPLDGSQVAMEVAAPLAQFAKAWGATVDLVRVVAPVPIVTPDAALPFVYIPSIADSEATEAAVAHARQELARDAEALRREGVTIGEQSIVVGNQPAAGIAGEATTSRADAIVMATHGRGMSRLFLGSVADKVRRATDVPVMLVRPRFARISQPALSRAAVEDQLPALAGSGKRG